MESEGKGINQLTHVFSSCPIYSSLSHKVYRPTQKQQFSGTTKGTRHAFFRAKTTDKADKVSVLSYL